MYLYMCMYEILILLTLVLDNMDAEGLEANKVKLADTSAAGNKDELELRINKTHKIRKL